MLERDANSVARRRQRLLSAWLVLTGLTVGAMLGLSMYWRMVDRLQASRDWLGWSILVMLLSVYISDIIRGVRRIPGDVDHCDHCVLVHPDLLRVLHDDEDARP